MLFRTADIEKELDMVEGKENRKGIEDYAEYLATKGVRVTTIQSEIIRLRKLSSILGDRFLNPSEDDIKKLSKWLHEGTYQKTNKNVVEYKTSTINGFIISLRAFYKHILGDDLEYPQVVRKLNIMKEEGKRPEKVITPEELKKLIENSGNLRDRTLISLMYDSGCRIGELANLRIRDVKFEDYGMVVDVYGKTGSRQVIVTGNSIAYLQQWIRDHPARENEDSFIFCKINGRDKGKVQVGYNDIHTLLNIASRKAGIKRRIHPHLFRHTYASRLASKVSESVLESQLGWQHGSTMSRIYVHLSLKDQKNAVLKANGIKVDEEEAIKVDRPIKCPRCSSLNESMARMCYNCWYPLVPEVAIEMKQKEDVAKSALLGTGLVNENEKLILNQLSPEAQLEVEAILLRELKRKGLLETLARETITNRVI